MLNFDQLPPTVMVRVKDVLALGVTRWRLRRLRAAGKLVKYRAGFVRAEVIRALGN